jgi:hypothetical protein
MFMLSEMAGYIDAERADFRLLATSVHIDGYRICLRPRTPLLPSEIFPSMEIFLEKKVPAILKVKLIFFL